VPLKNESEYLHVRIDPENVPGIKKLIKKTRRSVAAEVNLAVEEWLWRTRTIKHLYRNGRVRP